jgi:probable phosphoglycerate mutase
MWTQVTIVRHGETDWNRIGRLQGHRQIALSQRGREQAQAVADYLAAERFDAVLSSDLVRALSTAKAIAARKRQRVAADPRLREWHLGILSGLTHGEAARLHPEEYAIYRDAKSDESIPGGESPGQRHERVIRAVSELAERHPGGRVLVVTHGGPLDDCYRHATATPLLTPKDFQLYNAGINRFDIDPGQWRLESWGEIAHLTQIGTLGNWEPEDEDPMTTRSGLSSSQGITHAKASRDCRQGPGFDQLPSRPNGEEPFP